MFDIHFFQSVANLKKKIIKGEYNESDADLIAKELEGLRSSEPYVFNVETTNYCNMKCVMCPRTDLMTRKNIWVDDAVYNKVLEQITPHSDMDLETFWSFIADTYGIQKEDRDENHFYFHISARHLTLHGYGEPLLDKKIVEHVQICTDLNIPTYFSCVPANINVERIIQLMQSGLGVVKFSMDALDDENQKRIRGKNNNFKQAYEKILHVLKAKEALSLKTIIVLTMISIGSSNEDKKTHNEFKQLWADKDVYCYIKSQDNCWYYQDDENLVNKSHYAQQYCEYPWTSLTVMAGGEVVPCTQDYDTELCFGNIRDYSLKEIWNSTDYQDFRRMHVTGNFPKGHKCSERCDQVKLFQHLKKQA